MVYCCADPVARFHLRNGAILHRVNWFGNPSKSGFMSSAGFEISSIAMFSDSITLRLYSTFLRFDGQLLVPMA